MHFLISLTEKLFPSEKTVRHVTNIFFRYNSCNDMDVGLLCKLTREESIRKLRREKSKFIRKMQV